MNQQLQALLREEALQKIWAVYRESYNHPHAAIVAVGDVLRSLPDAGPAYRSIEEPAPRAWPPSAAVLTAVEAFEEALRAHVKAQLQNDGSDAAQATEKEHREVEAAARTRLLRLLR